MFIRVSSIPEDGERILFSEKETWVRENLSQALLGLFHADQTLKGHFFLKPDLDYLWVTGEVKFILFPPCDRCLKEFPLPFHIRFERLCAPLYESKRQKEIEQALELELTPDDLNFSYYEKDEISLGAILAEQVLLEQPMVYRCQPHCKGLCPHCGVNWNERTCDCDLQKEHSPFAVLKGWFQKK